MRTTSPPPAPTAPPASPSSTLAPGTATSDKPKPAKASSKPPEGAGGARHSHGSGPGPAIAGGPGGKGDGLKPLVGWAELKLGSLVLAQDDEQDGYWLAKIVATKADDHVVLVWEGYPDLPEFSRPRWTLALLHPEAIARVVTP